MRLNRRGEAGFAEAMMAAVAVALTLTAFMGALAYNTLTDTPDEGPRALPLPDLRVEGGEVTGDVGLCIAEAMERGSGVTFRAYVPGHGITPFEFRDGSDEGGVLERHVGSFVIGCDDGRALVCSYEVTVWT